jgi:hypothetical protein
MTKMMMPLLEGADRPGIERNQSEEMILRWASDVLGNQKSIRR